MGLGIEILISLCIPIVLIVLGRFVGRRIERNHYASIEEREARLASKPALSTRDARNLPPVADATLATGSVVVSVDHFKRFLSGFRMIVGGEVRSYSSLVERARREAVLRMKESQPEADAYMNTRLETSTISNTSGDEGVGTIEVLAYGTAVRYARLQNSGLPQR
ncbi:MAG: heavy metal-binding domain-containing protein [Myxococcota bacterium]